MNQKINRVALAEVFKIARIANDYNQKEAAVLAKVSPTYIADAEQGRKVHLEPVIECLSSIYNLKSAQIIELAEYYAYMDETHANAYQLTLYKALEMILKNESCFI